MVGCEPGVERALVKVLDPSRIDAGCLATHAFRPIRDDRLSYIHSKWQDEAAFHRHAELPYTMSFIACTPTHQPRGRAGGAGAPSGVISWNAFLVTHQDFSQMTLTCCNTLRQTAPYRYGRTL